MSYGIDYGMGKSNIDPDNGIRYGVINQNAVLEMWSESSEGDYGPATCPECGNDAIPIDDESVPDLDDNPPEGWEDNGRDYACLDCQISFNGDKAYGEEPLGFYLDDGEIKAESDSYGDIFIVKSPYYTHAQFCSPCAPGACHLENPVDDNGPRCYCFPPDWFQVYDNENCTGEYAGEKTSCPYAVFRVSDNECVFRPQLKQE
jgi:hypothetical protein